MLDPIKAGKSAVEAVIARNLGVDVGITHIEQLSGGASSATYKVEAQVGGAPQTYIFQRSVGASLNSTSRGVQAEVQARAGKLGVAVAPVIAKTLPEDSLGDGVVTGFMRGEALAPKWLRQPEYEAARAAMTRDCAVALAKLHAAPVSYWSDLPLKAGSGVELLGYMYDQYRRFDVHVPAFDLAFAFLKANMPDTPATCLVHGDFRSGNLLVVPTGLEAVVDWELTHLSVPAEDLGWLCVQAWRFGQWQLPVGGFGTREALLEAYREAGGKVDEAELHLWEVYGNLKWGMSCLELVNDHLSGRVPSVERAAIGRRVSEVAADLTYLLAFGDL